jgi:butyrate kinase
LDNDSADVDKYVNDGDNNQAFAYQVAVFQISHELGELVQVVGRQKHERFVDQVHFVC